MPKKKKASKGGKKKGVKKGGGSKKKKKSSSTTPAAAVWEPPFVKVALRSASFFDQDMPCNFVQIFRLDILVYQVRAWGKKKMKERCGRVVI